MSPSDSKDEGLADGTQSTAPRGAPTSTNLIPGDRFRTSIDDPSRNPLCLIACGSFSPVTLQHLHMFELAQEYIVSHTDFEVVAGYMSPVSDQYHKHGLASAEHRIRMCQLAVSEVSDHEDLDWLMTATWEADQEVFQPTAQVLAKFDQEINGIRGGLKMADGSRKHVHIALLAGSDLIQTMSIPDLWTIEDLDVILGRYGVFIIERPGSSIDKALKDLHRWRENIHVVQQSAQNDVSSTKIRGLLKKALSVSSLIPDSVARYIEENHLYKKDSVADGKALED